MWIWSGCRGIWRGGSKGGIARHQLSRKRRRGCQCTAHSERVPVWLQLVFRRSDGQLKRELGEGKVWEAQSRKAVREIVFLVSAAKQLLRMANQPVWRESHSSGASKRQKQEAS
jgi:hypothetical protein